MNLKAESSLEPQRLQPTLGFLFCELVMESRRTQSLEVKFESEDRKTKQNTTKNDRELKHYDMGECTQPTRGQGQGLAHLLPGCGYEG